MSSTCDGNDGRETVMAVIGGEQYELCRAPVDGDGSPNYKTVSSTMVVMGEKQCKPC